MSVGNSDQGSWSVIRETSFIDAATKPLVRKFLTYPGGRQQRITRKFCSVPIEMPLKAISVLTGPQKLSKKLSNTFTIKTTRSVTSSLLTKEILAELDRITEIALSRMPLESGEFQSDLLNQFLNLPKSP